MPLVRVLARDLGGGQTLFESSAGGRFLVEPILEAGVSRRRRSQIRCGTLLRALMRCRGGREGFFDLGAGRDRVGQGAVQFGLALRRLRRQRGDFQLPVTSGGIEGRSRLGQLLCERRTLLLRRFMFLQDIRN